MKGRRFVLAACGGLMMIAAAAGGAQASEATITKGVSIEGVDVGGMTKNQAEAALEEKAQQLGQTKVTLMMGDNPVTTTLGELGYTWTNTDIVGKCLTLASSGNIVERYKEKKDIEKEPKAYTMSFCADNAKVQSFVESCAAYNSDPVEGTIQMGSDGVPYVEGGTDGLTLNVDKSVAAVENAISGWTGGDLKVDLVVDKKSPDVSAETLSKVKDVLGTATTDYSASTAARAVNVENGCRLISGTLVWPGDEFSVTRAVTPFTAENGYQQAPSYEENRVVDSYGGGICQVSTTLYNAVLKAELDVTARSNHTMIVNYVQPSKDAAIAEGIMDMAFVNNTDSPIYIYGYCYGGQITFTIYGHETRPSNRSIEFESKVTSQTDPQGIQLVADTSQNVGYINQVQSPHTGYTAELWKNIYVDGQLTDSVQVNSSTYQAVGTIYDVGVVSQSSAVTQAMYSAIASGDVSQVQNVIKYGTNAAQGQTNAQGQNGESGQADAAQGQTNAQTQTDASGQSGTSQTDASGNAVISVQ